MEEFDPIARIEYFLEAVLNGDPAPFEPFARAEFYLAYLCGSAVTLPTPQSRVDFYLAYKCGEDVEIPDPIERIDFYLAKWCGVDCEVPDPIHPIEYYLNALANSGELKTVTGNPISVSDALAKPAESLTIEILPYQSGSGDPSPDNVRPISGFTGVNIPRTGKNLVDEANCTIYRKYFRSSGGNYYWYAFPDSSSVAIPCKPNTTYTISVANSDVSILRAGTINVPADSAEDSTQIYNSDVNGSYSRPITLTTDAYSKAIVVQVNNSIFQARNTQLQVELGSAATAYAPYTGTTYAIDWTDEAGTVYGGELNVTTGVMTVDRAIFEANTATMNNSEAYPGWRPAGMRENGAKGGTFNNGLTNVGRGYSVNVNNDNDIIYLPTQLYNGRTQSDWIALAVDVQIVYELATPITYQLTPTQVDMLLGNNVLWNDVDGDMTLEYLADGPADDIDALNILLNNRYFNNGEPDEATDKEALEILLGGNTR